MVGARMSKREMTEFIERVGRSELYDEFRQMEEDGLWDTHTADWGAVTSRYLKAVRASLVALGYDEHWVNGEFRDALNARYPFPCRSDFDKRFAAEYEGVLTEMFAPVSAILLQGRAAVL